MSVDPAPAPSPRHHHRHHPPPPPTTSSSAFLLPGAHGAAVTGSDAGLIDSFRSFTPLLPASIGASTADAYLPPLAPPSQRRDWPYSLGAAGDHPKAGDWLPPASASSRHGQLRASTPAAAAEENEDEFRIDFEALELPNLGPLDQPRNSPPRGSSHDQIIASVADLPALISSPSRPQTYHGVGGGGAPADHHSTAARSSSSGSDGSFGSALAAVVEGRDDLVDPAVAQAQQKRPGASNPDIDFDFSLSPLPPQQEDDDEASSSPNSSSKAIGVSAPNWPPDASAQAAEFYRDNAFAPAPWSSGPPRSYEEEGSDRFFPSNPSSFDPAVVGSWSSSAHSFSSSARAPSENAAGSSVRSLEARFGQAALYLPQNASPAGSLPSSLGSSGSSLGGYSNASRKRAREESLPLEGSAITAALEAAAAAASTCAPASAHPGVGAAVPVDFLPHIPALDGIPPFDPSTTVALERPHAFLSSHPFFSPPLIPPGAAFLVAGETPIRDPPNRFLLTREQLAAVVAPATGDPVTVQRSMERDECRWSGDVPGYVEYTNLPASLQRILHPPHSANAALGEGGSGGGYRGGGGDGGPSSLREGLPMVGRPRSPSAPGGEGRGGGRHRSSYSVSGVRSSSSNGFLHPDAARQVRSPRSASPSRRRSLSEPGTAFDTSSGTDDKSASSWTDGSDSHELRRTMSDDPTYPVQQRSVSAIEGIGRKKAKMETPSPDVAGMRDLSLPPIPSSSLSLSARARLMPEVVSAPTTTGFFPIRPVAAYAYPPGTAPYYAHGGAAPYATMSVPAPPIGMGQPGVYRPVYIGPQGWQAEPSMAPRDAWMAASGASMPPATVATGASTTSPPPPLTVTKATLDGDDFERSQWSANGMVRGVSGAMARSQGSSEGSSRSGSGRSSSRSSRSASPGTTAAPDQPPSSAASSFFLAEEGSGQMSPGISPAKRVKEMPGGAGNSKDPGEPMNQGGRGRREHEATRVCHICGADFTRNERLIYHMKTHSKTRDFPCQEPGCTKAFRQKSDLKRHLNTVHHKKGASASAAQASSTRLPPIPQSSAPSRAGVQPPPHAGMPAW